MADRPLSEDEQALWQRLVATVEPLERSRMAKPLAKSAAKSTGRAAPTPPPALSTPKPARAAIAPRPAAPITPGNLDRQWDRRLARGKLVPDVTVDLHGSDLAHAYSRLDGALALAIASGHRVMLLIAGRRRDHDRASGRGRGAIRAALDDWLAASRHAAHIAAVRPAHPRHGGAGALYIILKRQR